MSVLQRFRPHLVVSLQLPVKSLLLVLQNKIFHKNLELKKSHFNFKRAHLCGRGVTDFQPGGAGFESRQVSDLSFSFLDRHLCKECAGEVFFVVEEEFLLTRLAMLILPILLDKQCCILSKHTQVVPEHAA